MSDHPRQGAARKLVEEFRTGARSPAERIEATLAAIEDSAPGKLCGRRRASAHQRTWASHVRLNATVADLEPRSARSSSTSLWERPNRKHPDRQG